MGHTTDNSHHSLSKMTEHGESRYCSDYDVHLLSKGKVPQYFHHHQMRYKCSSLEKENQLITLKMQIGYMISSWRIFAGNWVTEIASCEGHSNLLANHTSTYCLSKQNYHYSTYSAWILTIITFPTAWKCRNNTR
jgi:hypothetical protein